MSDEKKQYRFNDLSTGEKAELFETILQKYLGHMNPHEKAEVRCPETTMQRLHARFSQGMRTSRQAVEKHLVQRDLTKAWYEAELNRITKGQRWK